MNSRATKSRSKSRSRLQSRSKSRNNIKSKIRSRSRPKSSKNWSGYVTATSDAIDVDPGIMTLDDPVAIAKSIKKNSDKSRRRKGTSYQSAINFITFYLNRGGTNIRPSQRQILEQAKIELRILYGRD